MKLHLRRAEQFSMDFENAFRWFAAEGGPELAVRFKAAVGLTFKRLITHPGIGRKPRFRHQKLKGIHSILVDRPFNNYLIFYRYDANTLDALRIIHGARDLPRRLLENGSDQLNESAQ